MEVTRSSSIGRLSTSEFEEVYGCDRFTAIVIASRFRYIVKHMCTHLLTTSFSPILRDWFDFSATLSGPPELRYPMAAVSESLMIFSGCMSEAVRNTVEEYGSDRLQPGDVLMCNEPGRTGTHINDVCFVRPVFTGDDLLGYVNIQPHMMDMGGPVPGGFSPSKRTIYEDGLTIPPMLLFEQDRPVSSALSLILENVRFSEIIHADILTLVAGLRMGERLLRDTADRYGISAVYGSMRYAVDLSAESMAIAFRGMPDGMFVGTDSIDCDAVDPDEEYLIRASVRIVGDRAEVDLSGSSRQARTSINAGHLDARTAVATALKFLIDPKTPFTSGVFRNIDLIIPPGSIVSALPPDGPTTMYGQSASALVIAVFDALADALGDSAVAGDFTSAMTHSANGVTSSGRRWVSLATCGGEHGPWGATKHADAENSLGSYLTNSIAPSVEGIEADVPAVLLRKEYAVDTAGAGQHRGGAATMKDTLWLEPAEHFSNALHVKRASGIGVYGGRAGRRGCVWLWHAAPDDDLFISRSDDAYRTAIPLAGVVNPETHAAEASGGVYFHFGREESWKTEAGAIFRYVNNAGGGWGSPLERDEEQVLRNVRDEYFSPQFARDVFGVVVVGDTAHDPESMYIDRTATARLRAEFHDQETAASQG